VSAHASRDASILVVDDTPSNLGFLIETLSGAGYRVRIANDGAAAIEQSKYAPPDLVLMDAMMPGMDGFETTRRLHALPAIADVPIIFMTALAEATDKVRAFAAGASDYITKPFQQDEVLARVHAHVARRRAEQALQASNSELEMRVTTRTQELTAALAELEALKTQLQQQNSYLKHEISEQLTGSIIGESPQLRRVLEQVALVAKTDSTVLIHGETGTGKEMIARAIHEQSARRDGALVKLNCSAISAGLVESELFGHVKGAFTGAVDRRIGRFELADGGTLFLDEVSELPLETQAKLLRILQEREFEPVGSNKTVRTNVRVVAATNRDLVADARSGRFREDLFYRLNVFPIHLPALRERRSDIPLLAAHFLQRFARKLGRRIERVEPRSLARLTAYDWPGNIRDLQNTIERAAVLATSDELSIGWQLGPSDAPSPRTAAVEAISTPRTETDAPSAMTLEQVERSHIIGVLRSTAGVIEGPNGAACRLDLKPSTARFRIRKLGIRRTDYLPE
jgi:formate hydrogenlyase transcriptional activator